MHTFTMHTLVDITKNGSLAKTFPFTTPAGDEIDGKETLKIARNQNNLYVSVMTLQPHSLANFTKDKIHHGISLFTQNRLICLQTQMVQSDS